MYFVEEITELTSGPLDAVVRQARKLHARGLLFVVLQLVFQTTHVIIEILDITSRHQTMGRNVKIVYVQNNQPFFIILASVY
jgi:hypothetical protein